MWLLWWISKVKFQGSEVAKHGAEAFAEKANRTLDEKEFSHQYAQEMVYVKLRPEVLLMADQLSGWKDFLLFLKRQIVNLLR